MPGLPDTAALADFLHAGDSPFEGRTSSPVEIDSMFSTSLFQSAKGRPDSTDMGIKGAGWPTNSIISGRKHIYKTGLKAFFMETI
jgi:hypothetical protein